MRVVMRTMVRGVHDEVTGLQMPDDCIGQVEGHGFCVPRVDVVCMQYLQPVSSMAEWSH